MKIFKEKREKNKVGRPKLANVPTKKKAIISVCVALIMVVALLLTGAFKLNIINLNKLKGIVLCTEIPARFRPYDEVSNPDGLHDYGFTDINFYSAAISGLYHGSSVSNPTYCSNATEEDLSSITVLYGNGDAIKIENMEGIEYLTGLTVANLSNNNLTSIDINKFKNITSLYIDGNNFESLEIKDMPNLEILNYMNNPNLKNIVLKNLPSLDSVLSDRFDNLEYLEVENVPNLTNIVVNASNLKNIKLINNPSLSYRVEQENASIESIYVDNIDKLELTDYGMYEKLKSFKVYNVNDLYGISQLYSSFLDELEIKNAVTRENDYITLTTTGEKLKNIDIASLKNLLDGLLLTNALNETINLSENVALQYLLVDGGNLTSLDLSSNHDLTFLLIKNNKIGTIDLSNQENMSLIYLGNNPIVNNVYLQKGNKFNYSDLIKLNSKYEITFEVEKDNIGKVENKVFTALNEGETIVRLYNEKIFGATDAFFNCFRKLSCTEEDVENGSLRYFFENKIKVYDVTSKDYNVNNNSKKIDLGNKTLDIEKIIVTEGYTKEINNNILTIKDGDILVDTYTLINVKAEASEESTTTATTTKQNNVTTTTQQNKTTTKKATKKTTSKTSSKATTKTNSTTTTKHNLPEEDLIVYGNYIPDTMLEQIKGQDINLTLINEDVSIVINGKDIEEVKDINIDYRLVKYEEDKQVDSGMLLEFINKKSLPKKFKILIRVNEEFEDVVGLKSIKIYDYSNNELNLMEENIDVTDEKISFSIDKLDKYIFTKNEIKKEEKKTNKCRIIWIIILLLLLLVIGYITYKKRKDKND